MTHQRSVPVCEVEFASIMRVEPARRGAYTAAVMSRVWVKVPAVAPEHRTKVCAGLALMLAQTRSLSHPELTVRLL